MRLSRLIFGEKLSDQIVEQNENIKKLEDFINNNGVGDLKDIKYIYRKDDTVKNGDHIGVIKQHWDSFGNDQLTIRAILNGNESVCFIHKYKNSYGGVIIFGNVGFEVYKVSQSNFIKVI